MQFGVEDKYGVEAMENEISSTMSIEDIEFSRDSVRKILKGFAPDNESENRIFGLKKGLEFISEHQNKITEKNINTLYHLAIGKYLEKDDDKLLKDNYYRHGAVYVVGQKIEHAGLPYQKLPEYMANLVDFINTQDDINDLLKAAAIHLFLAYIHPYFDGNGRMVRLLHQWYLVQQGYPATLFIPFSRFIEKSRKGYYNAYKLVEDNCKISGVLDITPFLVYFTENVYNKIAGYMPKPKTIDEFQNVLSAGQVTAKEKALWNFVLSAYGQNEFSTKQLEKDYGDAAYATIRGFVLKLENLGLLTCQSYGNKVKYKVKY
jgi:Fic family protein